MSPNRNSTLARIGTHASHFGSEAAREAVTKRLSRRKGSSGPPPVMTWTRAIPTIALAILFDALRAFFGMFWLFGPALATVYCTNTVNTAVGTSVAAGAGKIVAGACAAAAATIGTLFSPELTTFGVIMAMAIGLAGWLTVWFWLLMTNPRIFKENLADVLHVIWFYLCLFVIEIPFIGCAPWVSAVTYRMYKYQIKIETKALKEYEQEQVAISNQDRMQQMAYLTHIQQQEEATAEAEFEEQEQESMAEDFPEEMRLAA